MLETEAGEVLDAVAQAPNRKAIPKQLAAKKRRPADGWGDPLKI